MVIGSIATQTPVEISKVAGTFKQDIPSTASTTNKVHHTKAGHKVGMATTINFQIGEQRWVNDTKQTTVSPFYLQKLLRRMA